MKEADKKWSSVEAKLSLLMTYSDKFNLAHDGLMIAPESPLIEPFHVVMGVAIRSISDLVGDGFHSISWYVYECDFGRESKEAGADGDMRVIDNVEKLRWLIELDESK